MDDWPEQADVDPFGEREPVTLGEVIDRLKADGLLVPDVELAVDGDRVVFTDEPLIGSLLGREPDEFRPLGRSVRCDECSTDFTDSDRQGGFLFGSHAVGPCCAERIEESARGYGELDHIRGRCPADTSFADWVRGFRGPNAGISIYR